MINQTYLLVLRKICEKLQNTDVNWVVTGSLAFALQGARIEPHDIDIQTDQRGAYEIEHLLSEFVVEKVTFSSSESIRSHFGVLMIDGIKVEVMGDIQKRSERGDWGAPVDLEHHKRFIEVGRMQVPVLSLEYEYQAYLKLGRIDEAQMLRRLLDGEEDSNE